MAELGWGKYFGMTVAVIALNDLSPVGDSTGQTWLC